MKKKLSQFKTVFAEDGLFIKGAPSLIEGVGIKAAKVIPDERGRLGEIMRADDPWFEQFGQVYFTSTYPGVVKAWHYHKKQTDHFYVIKGSIKVGLYDDREDSATYKSVNEVYLSQYTPALLRIPPGVQHGWMCVVTEEAYILNVVSEMYDYANPDEFRTDPHENEIPYDWARKDG
jgi:dTDP-4-dehydrorhamnose 3,5-epimerase